MSTIANLTTYISGESAAFLNTIEQTRGGLRSLVSSLDPVAAATARYNKQVDLLDKGLRTNRLTLDQHATLMQRLGARYQDQIRGQQALTGQTGQMRAGFQQLSFQIGDIGTQFASGTRPMQIFAQQGSQVLMAISMMQRESKGFIGFMAGPWGQVILAAGLILSQFTSKLFENAEASKAAELANDGLSEAQSVLGKMFDMTSGKLEKQNDLLRLNAMLTAQNLKVEAMAAKTRAESAAGSAQFSTTDKILTVLSRRGNMIEGAEAAGGRVSSAIQGVLSGKLAADKALAGVSKGDLGILGISQLEFQTAIKDAVESVAKGKTADDITKSLQTGVLAPSLRTPDDSKPKKGPKDRSDQRMERFDDQIARLQQEQVGLLMALTSDIHDRAELMKMRVEDDVKAYRVDIEHQVAQKEITAEKGKELIAAKEANAVLETKRIIRDMENEYSQERISLAQSELATANTIRAGELDAAQTQEDRRRIQLAMLDAEMKTLRYSIEQQLLTKDLNEGKRKLLQSDLARLNAEEANRRGYIERQTMGPMASYLDGLRKSAGELNEDYQRVAVDGLRSLNDGLVEAIMNSKSLGETFKNIANQIIADLLRIAIQKSITAPLANMLFSGGGLLGGLIGGKSGGLGPAVPTSWGSLDFGGGTANLSGLTGALSNLRRFAKGGEFKVGGLSGIDRNILSINGIPRAMVSGDETVRVNPANDRGRAPEIVIRQVFQESANLLPTVQTISEGVTVQQVTRSAAYSARAGRQRLGRR